MIAKNKTKTSNLQIQNERCFSKKQQKSVYESAFSSKNNCFSIKWAGSDSVNNSIKPHHMFNG